MIFPSAAIEAPTPLARRRICGPSHRFGPGLVIAVLTVLAPAAACADVYTWTNERGSIVISNLRPSNPEKLSNFEVIKDAGREPQTGRTSAEPSRMEQRLLDRIDTLEREIRTQQYAAAPAVVYQTPPAYYAPPPPAAPAYEPGFYSPYFYPSYSYVVLPGSRFFGRSRFSPGGHGGFHHRGSMHRPGRMR